MNDGTHEREKAIDALDTSYRQCI